jgi:hypothetical protein
MKSEAKIQQECVMWFRNNYCLKHHDPKCVIFSVPNEGKNPQEQAAKIQTGLLSGVADLVLLFPNGKCVFIEMKDDKGTQKPKQIRFEENVNTLGFEYYICRSLKDFQRIVTQL